MTAYPSAYPPAEPTGPGGAPPLDQPHYGIGFLPAVSRAFRKYATFTGRASRSEYWWWTLFTTIGFLVLGVLALVLGLATSTDRGKTPGAGGAVFLVLMMVFLLGVILPSIAVSVRRLHDSGNSGWLYLLVLIPYVGGVVQIVFGFLGTSPNGLRFEPDPARAVLPPGMTAGAAPYGAPYGYAAPPPGYGPPPQGYGAPPQGYGYPPPPSGYAAPPAAPDYSQPPTASGYPPPRAYPPPPAAYPPPPAAYPPPPQAYPPPQSPQDRPTDEQGYGRQSS